MVTKIGRNSPCPCGSGKKLKKCCGKENKAVSDSPNVDQLLNSAVQLQIDGDIEKARSLYHKVLQHDPNNDNALNLLGVIAYKSGDLDNAIDLISRALLIDPNAGEFQYNLAKAMQDKGDAQKALLHYQKALEIHPDLVDAHINLGLLFFNNHQYEEAKIHYKYASQLEPDNYETLFNLAQTLVNLGHYEDAIKCYKKSLLNRPTYIAQLELGNALYNLGRPEDASEQFNLALDMASGSDKAITFSNILLTLNYSGTRTAENIFNEHLKYSRKFAEPLVPFIPVHNNNSEQERRIKIGYVSGDFRKHSVAFFISPVLEHHNPEQVEVYCYCNNKEKDKLTEQIKNYCHHWRDIYSLSDDKATELIQKDQIDILVDLSGHTSAGRLLVFARKPAPIQVSWIGYPNTTGLSTIDYRITDAYADPIGTTEKYYSERLIRLPGSFSCFSPPDNSPDVGVPPSFNSEVFTFGCFNKLAKITPDSINVWAQILLELPNSQLLLKTAALHESSVRNDLRNNFSTYGVDPSRVICIERDVSQIEHLTKYNQVDIALDTFPYNGTTTTCEALWMGVPVIVLEGNSHVSRVGVSQMINLGLKEHIAQSKEEYVRIAVNLARDSDKLSVLRKKLRENMMMSPLMDAESLTNNIEKAYRDMWKDWCLNQSKSDS